MAAEAPRSSGAADSYIGSLISLTSKFEIRYEGILYNINTEESTIGLENVRSFGTEGRKKDGPQIPPNDKVYNYILFRGSDIKDLQVKSSPPAQAPTVHNDPAIIQSHYSQPPPVPTSVLPLESGPAPDLVSHTAPGLPTNPNLHPSQAPPPASAPPVGSGTVPDLTSHAAPSLPRSTYQGGLPLYTSSVNLGPWVSSPGMPSANGSGVAVPPGYWQGYYVPPSGLAPHIQQFRPHPPGLPMHHPLQQPMHYAGMNPGLPTNAPYLSEFSSPLLPPISLASTTGGAYPGSASAPLTSALSSTQASALASETSTAVTTNQAPITSPPPNLGSNISLMPSSYDAKNTSALVSDKSQALPGPTFTPQTLSHSLSASVVSPPITRTETLVVPSLVTPGQLLQPGPSTLTSSKAKHVENKDVENMPSVSSEQSLLGAGDHQAPILPLPTPYSSKVDGSAPPMRYSYRGRERGRGSGISRAGTKFTEEFDFSAMNEKFNKDEVWGELGKSKGYADADEDLDIEVDYSKQDNKPVYVKDDFFDTLSCNSLDHGNRNGRTRFSEQMKLDTETFGDFPRHRGNRGGRGPPRGGRGRGSYYGRGYGYVGRGRS